jgi:hypothetical protein
MIRSFYEPDQMCCFGGADRFAKASVIDSARITIPHFRSCYDSPGAYVPSRREQKIVAGA